MAPAVAWQSQPQAPHAPQRLRATVQMAAEEPEKERGARLDLYGRSTEVVVADDETDWRGSSSQSEPVVKVYCVHCSPNPAQPWSNKPQEESTGSGFTIEQGGELCILTNAHVVADATYIEVRKAGDARKFVATRRKVAHECDLALLQVEDDGFWDGVTPLAFGSMPCLQDEVSVVGYPEGGEGVSITQGVISRIEIQRYAHSGISLLAIQIDAAINPGNSGGPALDEEGSVIGVAFQNQQDSQNIGYVIPVPTIRHFLDDTFPPGSHHSLLAEQRGFDGFSGFCSLGVFWQALENEQARRYFGMDGASGVLIRGLFPIAAAASILRRGDILTELEGYSLASDGTIAVGQQERLSFQHLIHLKSPGEAVSLALIRDGAPLALSVPVHPLSKFVAATTYDVAPSYFIYAGLVFVVLTEPYLHEWGDEWISDAPNELVQLALGGFPADEDEEPVILSRCFPSKQTAGYLTLSDRRVLSVNGERVVHLRQFYELVWRLHTEVAFLTFELQCVGGNALIAIDTGTAESEGEAILHKYRIPAAASADLRRADEAPGGMG